MGIFKRESSGSYSLVRDGQERQTVASQEHREVGFPVGEQCSADITVVLLSPEQASSMMVSKEFCDDCHFSKEAILRVGVEGLFFPPKSVTWWRFVGIRLSLPSRKQDTLYNSFLEITFAVSGPSSPLESRRAAGRVISVTLHACYSPPDLPPTPKAIVLAL